MNGNRLRFSTIFQLWICVMIGNFLGSLFFDGASVVLISSYQGITLLVLWLLVRYCPDFP